MGIFEIIGGFLLILCSIIVIVSVTMQETKGGLGSAMGGSANTSFFDKNRSKTAEASLARATIFGGAGLFICTLAVLAASIYA